MDEDGSSAQMIYTLQAAQCENPGTLCSWIILYRGTQNSLGTLVPLGRTRSGHNASIITVKVTVEDNMGAEVTAVERCVCEMLLRECSLYYIFICSNLPSE